MNRPDAAPPLLQPNFAGIDAWIFDLDNTLYPSSCDLFAEIEVRMGYFISQLLGVDRDTAHRLRREYYVNHGTTLAGLMARHQINPSGFLSFVHDVNLNVVPPNPNLARMIARLPGRKVIFTNGTARHAERVIDRLGIGDHFEFVFDIQAADYVPKPAEKTFDALLAQLDCDPVRAAMFDDIAANLAPAHARGMKTIWVRTPKNWAAEPQGTLPQVHFETQDLTTFLAEFVFHAD